MIKTLLRPAWVTIKKFLPLSVQQHIWEYRVARWVSNAKDRPVFYNEVLPHLLSQPQTKGDILYVGTARYTKDVYKRLESKGGRVWTIEIDPTQAIYGRKGRHTVGDVCKLAEIYTPRQFDLIILTGVLGDGVNTLDAQKKVFAGMNVVLKDDGMVLTGNNTVLRVKDVLPLAQPFFNRVHQWKVPNAEFVFDLLTKTAGG